MSRAISLTVSRYLGALAATCLVALTLNVADAHAATQDQQEKACRADAFKYCSAEIPSKKKIAACMKQHMSQLSPGCQAMFKSGQHAPAEPSG
jgi:hypothetical protein